MNKLKLSALIVKSFVTIQSDLAKETIKGGDLGSDGPPHTSSTNTLQLTCPTGYASCNCHQTEDCQASTDAYK